MSMSEMSKLRWRCRRGMRELDEVLVFYLEERYLQATESEQAAFKRLLDCEEPDLLSFITRRDRPEDEGVARVVDAICEAYSFKNAQRLDASKD